MGWREDRRRLGRFSGNPEQNLMFFSFLVNFVWEMWQLPYYRAWRRSVPHVDAVRACTLASLGDGIISLLAFWTAAIFRTRRWYMRLRLGAFSIYLASGVAITILMEWRATGPLERWRYDAAMPRLPVLGTGLLTVLQWLLLPPIILALMRRQTRTALRASSKKRRALER